MTPAHVSDDGDGADEAAVGVAATLPCAGAAADVHLRVPGVGAIGCAGVHVTPDLEVRIGGWCGPDGPSEQVVEICGGVLEHEAARIACAGALDNDLRWVGWCSSRASTGPGSACQPCTKNRLGANLPCR